jgi:cobaltochelatase CobS
VPNGTPKPAGDDLATAAALLAALRPTVDADSIRGMITEQHGSYAAELLSKVDAKIDQITAPVTVQIKTDTETRVIPGLTHKSVPTVLTVLNAGEHCLMVGPAGTGKSTIAEQCADALGVSYYSISLSPQTPASSLLGYMQAAGEYVASLYRQAFEHGGVFHFDEFDNAHPSVLAVINASLANGHMAFPDKMVARHPEFRVCASANTYGRGPDRQYVGRQALDAATLDRFSIVSVEYDRALENELCKGTGAAGNVVREVLSYVWQLRDNAERHKMTLIFSPRASVGMCRLINAGMPVNEAIESRARRGISDADWAKVTQGVSLPHL